VLCGSFSKSTAESAYLCSCCVCSEWSVGDPEIRCARRGIKKEKHRKAVRSETQNKKAAQISQTSSNASLHLATSGLSFGDDASCPSCGVVRVVSSEPDKGDMNESDRRICISCELILVPSSRRAVRSLLSNRSVSMFSSSVTPIFENQVARRKQKRGLYVFFWEKMRDGDFRDILSSALLIQLQ